MGQACWDRQYLCSKLKYLTKILYKINKINNSEIIEKICFIYAHSLFQYNIDRQEWPTIDPLIHFFCIKKKHTTRAVLRNNEFIRVNKFLKQ